MQILGKLLLGLITSIISFCILIFPASIWVENGALGSGIFIFLIALPVITIFMPTMRKAWGLAALTFGLILISIPVAMSGLFSDMQTSIDGIGASGLVENTGKVILNEGVGMMRASFILFTGLIALVISAVGVLLLFTRPPNIKKRHFTVGSDSQKK